jgi:hypothetical protein
MDAVDHFAYFISLMPIPIQHIYHSNKAVRVETGHKGRNFIIYKMRDDHPKEIDQIIVNDFSCDEMVGASSEIELQSSGETMILDYTPQQVFDFPIFMWLPLSSKVRWAAPKSSPMEGSLGFPIAIRTRSRQGLREPGVVHCETGADFGREFGGLRVTK